MAPSAPSWLRSTCSLRRPRPGLAVCHFFTGQFVLPALKVKEKAFLYPVPASAAAFVVGIAFCYFLIVQVALMASVQFSQWMAGADEWRAEDYVSLCRSSCWAWPEFPASLVILTLVKIGLVTKTLSAWRQYFIVGISWSPRWSRTSGDPLTMVLMALPCRFSRGSLLIGAGPERSRR
jgi:Sec-independent protein secretion pathway component TatC